ncbi:MAG: SCO family protein [Deltaproteobacteria bacterium]|nr:SCO family protein [Deltaproteobacteria bacterium]
MGRLIIFIGLVVVAALTNAYAEISLETSKKAIQAAEWAEGTTPRDYILVDQDGKTFRLSEYFGKGKPLLVSFIYTSCTAVCPTITGSLSKAALEARKEFGDKFNVLTIGFDSEIDTPERLREYGKRFTDNFRFMRFATGSKDTIEKMTKDFGFFYQKEKWGFNHLNMISVVNAQGKIYKQVYGQKLIPADIETPLKELITGRMPKQGTLTLIDRIKLFCSTYDPATGRYVVNWPVIIGFLVQLVLILIIVFAVWGRSILSLFSKIHPRGVKPV